MQTSVKKYNASGEERGAILDFLDYPLNNRWWLSDEFAKIRKMIAKRKARPSENYLHVGKPGHWQLLRRYF
jgi:hypothetical protein